MLGTGAATSECGAWGGAPLADSCIGICVNAEDFVSISSVFAALLRRMRGATLDIE